MSKKCPRKRNINYIVIENDSLSINDNDNSLEISVNNWNKYIKEIFSSISNFIKIYGICVLTLLPGVFYIMISGKNSSLRNIFMFKFGLPLIGFLAFGPCFYAFINMLKEKKIILNIQQKINSVKKII